MKRRLGSVYRLQNKVTGSFYVGKTFLAIEKRLTVHRKSGVNRFIRYDLKKFGREVFEIHLIEGDIPAKDLDKRETYWIKILRPQYNLRKTKNKKWGKAVYQKSVMDPEP